MKNKSILALLGVVTVTALTTLGFFRVPRTARAQDDVGPPIHVKSSDHISSGMVGIAQGQTLRLSVVNIEEAGCPCQRFMQLNFRDADDQLLRRADGSVVELTVELHPGKAAFLDLNYDDLPPGPTRQQLRAVVTGLTPPDGTNEAHKPFRDHIATTVEVFDNLTGRGGIYASGGFEKIR